MQVENKHMPDAQQLEKLSQPGPQGPIFMINLVKYKKRAQYEDGRKNDLTGKQAYRLYGMEVIKMLPRYHAEVIFSSHITEIMVGKTEELWDEMTLVKYASRADLLAMTTSKEWIAANVHRMAGIEGQLNIESVSAFPVKAAKEATKPHKNAEP
ncbi:MAG: hypothetical protein MI742_06550 [Desulfobacterales bacterium]|nr:hypothetical protein [Desulfobacterales bacterium]